MNFITSVWHKYFGGKSTPWANVSLVGGRVNIKDYNKAFVDDLRVKLGDLTDGKDDAQVVQLFTSRENIELEEPRLDVQHMGITEDGRIKMKLDWNPAFIRHLAENGIQAESEEQSVQMYLALLTQQSAEDDVNMMFSKEEMDAAFQEIDKETEAELMEAARQVQERAQSMKKRKTRRPPAH